MTPMQVWSNESQERYVLAIPGDRLDAFRALCERERCPFAVVGEVVDAGALQAASAPSAVVAASAPTLRSSVRRPTRVAIRASSNDRATSVKRLNRSRAAVPQGRNGWKTKEAMLAGTERPRGSGGRGVLDGRRLSLARTSRPRSEVAAGSHGSVAGRGRRAATGASVCCNWYSC